MSCENLEKGQRVVYKNRVQIVDWIDRKASDGHHYVDVYDEITGMHIPFDDRPTGILYAIGYRINALKPIEVEETGE